MTRTITTVSELDALPVGSVVMCDDEHGVAKRVDADIYDGYDWLVVGSDEYRETHEMTWVLPAVVLHDPSASVVPVVSDAAVEAAAVAIHAEGWTCEAHEPEGLDACEQCATSTPRLARAVLSAALPFLGAAPSATREDDLLRALDAYRAETKRASQSDSLGASIAILAGAALANAVESAITPRTDR